MASGRGLRARVHRRRGAAPDGDPAPTPGLAVASCVAVVLIALGLAGWVGAVLSGGRRAVAVARVVIGDALSLAITCLVGNLLGTAVG